MTVIRVCGTADVPVIFEIVNDSAQAYKGVIPEDAWHEPYMSMTELESEIARGVRFYGCDLGGRILDVMGIQNVKDVTLIRHAYVRTVSRDQAIAHTRLEHMNHL